MCFRQHVGFSLTEAIRSLRKSGVVVVPPAAATMLALPPPHEGVCVHACKVICEGNAGTAIQVCGGTYLRQRLPCSPCSTVCRARHASAHVFHLSKLFVLHVSRAVFDVSCQHYVTMSVRACDSFALANTAMRSIHELGSAQLCVLQSRNT